MMSPTIQSMISDAKRLAMRLKEHDSSADNLLSQSQSVKNQLEIMKQYKDNVTELNEVAHQKPHTAVAAEIQQEGRRINRLQQENQELRAALLEHQNALEFIMSKYRQHTDTLIRQNKLNIGQFRNIEDGPCKNIVQKQATKIGEMAAVMRQAAQLDEESSIKDIENISQLITENKGLRELLQISRGSFESLRQKTKEEPKPEETQKEKENEEW